MIKINGRFKKIVEFYSKISCNIRNFSNIKRFKHGEIPEVLKYDRNYGKYYFYSLIKKKKIIRNRHPTKQYNRIFRALAFTISIVEILLISKK